MTTVAVTTAAATPAQLIARINAAGGIAPADVTVEQVLRLVLLMALALDDAGVELPDEISNQLDGFDPDDDSNESPT